MRIAKKIAHKAEVIKGGSRKIAGRGTGSRRLQAEGRGDVVGAGAGSGTHLIGAVLDDFVRETGASGCLVYLLPPGERVLRLAMLRGVPRQVAAHWTQVPLAARTPATDAVRERCLVWIGCQEEMARHYPQMALALPYPFSAAVPRSPPAPQHGAPWSCGGPARIHRR